MMIKMRHTFITVFAMHGVYVNFRLTHPAVFDLGLRLRVVLVGLVGIVGGVVGFFGLHLFGTSFGFFGVAFGGVGVWFSTQVFVEAFVHAVGFGGDVGVVYAGDGYGSEEYGEGDG